MSRVDIGFSEPCESWQIESAQFPSKIGGKPAWLSYNKLPTLEELQCSTCHQQLIFLCQIYAPYEDCGENFHRTLFIFICKNSSCSERNSNKNMKVFRSNLARKNDFYSYDPPSDTAVNFSAEKWVKLCDLCGCPGTKNCSKCKEAVYCCREHQVLDWKESHKNTCGQLKKKNIRSNYLFSESEIVIEAEELDVKDVDEVEEMTKFEQLQLQGKAGTLAEINEEDLEAHASVDKDKVFTQFRKRILNNPEQILRYERGGQPLWIADKPIPENIPDCEKCGGPRQFELQIMPQLLTILKENDLDFGTLAVYTCKKSCYNELGYKLEFIYKQDVKDNE